MPIGGFLETGREDMRKRVLSLVLAAVMLLGLAPAALADSGRSRRESFMSVAESQLGYREKFQNGTKYGSWYGLPGQPWCAMFVSWCARYSGVPESVIPNFSGCFGGVKWFKERGLWRTKEYTPQAGDLLFIDALEDNGKRRHRRARKRNDDIHHRGQQYKRHGRAPRKTARRLRSGLRHAAVRHDRLAIGHDIGIRCRRSERHPRRRGFQYKRHCPLRQHNNLAVCRYPQPGRRLFLLRADIPQEQDCRSLRS